MDKFQYIVSEKAGTPKKGDNYQVVGLNRIYKSHARHEHQVSKKRT